MKYMVRTSGITGRPIVKAMPDNWPLGNVYSTIEEAKANYIRKRKRNNKENLEAVNNLLSSVETTLVNIKLAAELTERDVTT